MTIEEKAKAYDEAYKVAAELHNLCKEGTQTAFHRANLEMMFPKLKESEDERIRKTITAVIGCYDSENSYFKEVSKKKCLAWLEKQGEQKSADKVEPKFKVGDIIIKSQNSDINKFGKFKITDIKDGRYWVNEFVICEISEQDEWKLVKVKPKLFNVGDWIISIDDEGNRTIEKIIEFWGDKVRLIDTNGYYTLWPQHELNYYHLWAIQDAKDGDVLCCENGWTCIFKTLVNDETFSSYCFMDNTKWFCETGSECHTLKEEFVKAYNGKIYPATKEQRDTLFAKIKEAGYEWDGNKKELKKIEQKPVIKMKTPEESLGISSEEYNKIVDECIYGDDKSTWGKPKLKEREQKPAEWSVEDILMLSSCIEIMLTVDSTEEQQNWLKSLQYRMQPQQEWSEKDENYINDLIKYFSQNERLENTKEDIVIWLKSLRPQNRWKPR